MNRRVIYKYPFTGGAMLAPNGMVRLVAEQHGSGVLTIWIEHDLGAPSDTGYYLVATGEDFNSGDDVHVGSAVCGHFVWHVFKRVSL